MMFKHFIQGFLSVFKLGMISVKHIETVDIAENFTQVLDDLNNSYIKLKSEYEG